MWMSIVNRKNEIRANYTPSKPNGHGHGFISGVSGIRALVPLKTNRVEEQMHIKSVEVQSFPVGVVARMSSSSLGQGSKL
ncbi:hypothetical protein TNCV_2953591 [Trichonephila clavipes]|nr:hypothetical protein TNCV_2953591 [Trichonephila clavipes]